MAGLFRRVKYPRFARGTPRTPRHAPCTVEYALTDHHIGLRATPIDKVAHRRQLWNQDGSLKGRGEFGIHISHECGSLWRWCRNDDMACGRKLIPLTVGQEPPTPTGSQ